ncbi:group II intron maturase-specific domain-containing protein [uncultured Nonlabens sp.]|uniref:group II intron maturase-specific domain-containing protein n=1 Tax=uncultured Nonlabens sp. TaxID=859306 RepID=UPI003457BFFA
MWQHYYCKYTPYLRQGIIAAKVRGWIHYYGKVRMSELYYVFGFLNKRLAKWVRNKYRRFRRKHWFFAYKWLQETAKQYPTMFVHWQYGFMP